MDKEKIVVILLLATIILSIASIAVTFNFNSDNIFNFKTNNAVSGNNGGNVKLAIESAPGAADENN
ncbi:MAG: hypothetical protein PVJ67_04565 [Candidatus Pacearchaeota archaeon]|jgi:hypothetical protein